MDLKSTRAGEAGALALVASRRAGSDATALRSRLRLESLWERKVDEVIALAAAAQGESIAGDDQLASAQRSRRIHQWTAGAYEDLADIVDAIARVDDGTYGQCVSCHRHMPDEWLADEPQIRYCPKCRAGRRVKRRRVPLTEA